MRTPSLVILLLAGWPLTSLSSPTAVKRTSMDGTWAMCWAKPGDGGRLNYAGLQQPAGEWIPCAVPGTAQAAMLEAGKITDPLFGKNSLDILWMENEEWWFRKEFSVSVRQNSRYRIEFDGVDHYATVYLNGKELGRHTGMFHPFAFDVTGLLKPGSANVLCVKIDPPPQVDKADRELKSQVYYCSQSLHIAWAYVHLLTIGIWKSVRLVETPAAEIQHPFIRTLDQSSALAHLRISGEVAAQSALEGARLKIGIKGANCSAEPQSFATGVQFPSSSTGRFDATIEVKNPRLWWPNGLGAQNLYSATLQLMDSAGKVLDAQTVRFGIRTITTMRNPESRPEWYDWTFCVNDKPFFVRGANWIPPVDLLLRPMPDKARHMVWLARQAGMNMFRIWGGGPTESEHFYDLCDEYGILTQEESPLGIPGLDSQVDPQQYRDVVTGQVLATRNHPSLAVYCGGNEWDPRLPRNKALVEILRKVTTDLDGTRVFRPVSPWGGDDHDYSSGACNDYFYSSDAEEDYTVFNRNPTPFMSETGTLGTPCYETLKKFIPDCDLRSWPPDRESSFMHHQIYNRCSMRDSLIRYAENYGAVRNYEELVPQSMLVPARLVSYVIGHLRADWPRKSGITFWEMKDAWPAVSNGSVDYYGVPKTLYYFVKRAYAPVAIFSQFAANSWEAGSTFSADIFAASDNEDLSGCTVLVEIYDPCLKQLASQVFPTQLKAGTSCTVGHFQWPVPPGDEFPFLYVITLKRPDGTSVASETYWLNLSALNGYQTRPRDHITFQLGDPEQNNAVKCSGQEIEFPPVVANMPVTHQALALLVTAAGTQGWNRADLTVYDSGSIWGSDHRRPEKTSFFIPDWWDRGGWVPNQLGEGLRFTHHLDANKAISTIPVHLHVAYIPLNESRFLKKIVLPTQPEGRGAYYIFAAAVKHDHLWQTITLSNLYNCDVVGRQNVANSGNLFDGTAFDQQEWKQEVTVPAPDVPRTRLIDVLPKTTLRGRVTSQHHGAVLLNVQNIGPYPAYLGEVYVGQAALGLFIPDDNYFWLAPGQSRNVLVERSPVAGEPINLSSIGGAGKA